MTSELHRQAIGSLRAVALDAPDIDVLATFYEQLAGGNACWTTTMSGSRSTPVTAGE